MWQIVSTCELKAKDVVPGIKGRSVLFRWHLLSSTWYPRGSPELGLCRWKKQTNRLCERWEFLPISFRLSSLSFRCLGTSCFCDLRVQGSASVLQSLYVRPASSGQCHQHLGFILTASHHQPAECHNPGPAANCPPFSSLRPWLPGSKHEHLHVFQFI